MVSLANILVDDQFHQQIEFTNQCFEMQIT